MVKSTLYPFRLLAGLCWLIGCSHTPDMYKMPPKQVEEIRSGYQSVGIVVSSYSTKPEILRPAKGPLNGAGRGFVIGAALPVMVGFSSPFPLGGVAGLFIAPVTGVAGSIYGAATAVPVREVAVAQAAIEQAVANNRALDQRQDFLYNLVALGAQRTDLDFIILDDIGPAHRTDYPSYNHIINTAGIDVILEIRLEKFGLRGFFTIDPYSRLFKQIRARLIKRKDNTVLFDVEYTCSSERKMKYNQWANHSGELIVEESFACATELAEKIIDDFFLVVPIRNGSR
jgi:hypothetical protein